MSELIEKELSDIEESIRAAVVAGQESDYHKLLRMKTEAESRLFFRRQKDLKSEIESQTAERQNAIEVISDLQAELTAQAEKVLELRSQAFDEQEKHTRINLQLQLLRTKVENDREEIRDLQQKLDLATDKKLNPDNYDESGNLKRVVETNG